MNERAAVVVTSINKPNSALRALAEGAVQGNASFFVIGDVSSPARFHLDGCSFYSLDRQDSTGLRTARLCPRRHYARKNVGYLEAIRQGARLLIETDDDNVPRPEFWEARALEHRVRVVERAGWLNAYSYFTDENIWPRGLPLDAVHSGVPPWENLARKDVVCPIQQGLADDNPDVDAIYRLVLARPVQFRADRRLALGAGSWCPFNSQNTSWWPDAWPLMYLPAYCSFRMTDIWRSFAAQRIAWANDWAILFHEPSVSQERNAHDLMKDFAEEMPGYLNNRRIGEALEKLVIPGGAGRIPDNLRLCYEEFVRMGLVEAKELTLLEAWLADLNDLQALPKCGNVPRDQP